jgi:hypothetical protein
MWHDENAMFIGKKTFYRQDGTKREYLQIVKACREKDKIHQRVVCNLGHIEELKMRKYREPYPGDGKVQ